MNFTEYAPLARVTMKELPVLEDHLIHMALGVIGEFGELVDAVKKVVVYDKPVDQTNLVEEIGDVLWYYAGMHAELGIDLKVSQDALAEVTIIPWGPGAPDLSLPFGKGRALVMLSALAAEACNEIMEDVSEAESQMQTLTAVIATTARILDVNLEEAMSLNIAKLKARYGDKFSAHAALNRDLGNERKVLEGPAD